MYLSIINLVESGKPAVQSSKRQMFSVVKRRKRWRHVQRHSGSLCCQAEMERSEASTVGMSCFAWAHSKSACLHTPSKPTASQPDRWSRSSASHCRSALSFHEVVHHFVPRCRFRWHRQRPRSRIELQFRMICDGSKPECLPFLFLTACVYLIDNIGFGSRLLQCRPP